MQLPYMKLRHLSRPQRLDWTMRQTVSGHTAQRDSRRRLALRFGLRLLVVVGIMLFVAQAYYDLALLAAASALLLYLASVWLRPRSENGADLLMSLGDLPLLVAAVHLTSHALGFEALVPAWLIGVTIVNLRKGRTGLLPLHSLVAWLVLASQAPSTAQPLGYLAVQTVIIGIASVVALSVVREQRSHRYDSLTGVLTRKAGLEELERFASKHRTSVLAFVDLRRFKDINDRYGHLVGDEVLSILAQRLRRALRHEDILFRYGGDEFVVASEAPDLEARLRQVFTTPLHTSSGSVSMGARIGIKKLESGVTLDEVVQEADRRMYADSRPDDLLTT